MPIPAKYPGRCCYCGKPIAVGKDIYDVETKRNWHVACEPQPLPFDRSEAEAQADRLGFITFDDYDAGMYERWRAWKTVGD